jgi:hypothetical protein
LAGDEEKKRMVTKAPTIDAIVRGPSLFRHGIRIASELYVGDPLGLVREPENPVDPNAVIITDSKERPFAYIQREKAGELSKWMDNGWVYTCKVLVAPIVAHRQGWIGFKRDSMIVRCTPIQPIAKKKEIDLSVLFGLDKIKELEET